MDDVVDTPESLAVFQEAQALANIGEVDDARLVCHRYISLYGANARVFFLLGMLEVASRRDEEAAQHFKKAVYLEPRHYEALVNLALIADRRGALDEAERFWRRARKLASRAEVQS